MEVHKVTTNVNHNKTALVIMSQNLKCTQFDQSAPVADTQTHKSFFFFSFLSTDF